MDFKKIIKEEKYGFLYSDNVLKDKIMLLTIGGSYAYGTNVTSKEHESDIDIRGIYLNSKEEILLMNCEDKPYENKELDVVIYPLKQILNLLLNCNPNTLEILGTRDEDLLMISNYGKILRDNRDVFLSKKAYASFGGYAVQQLRRLQNSLARDNYPSEEKEKHILKSIEKQMLTFEDRYIKCPKDQIHLYIDKSNRDTMENEIFIDMKIEKYPLREVKGMLGEMNQVVRDYDKLNHRNSKKDQQHILKHAMHLIRILKMGTEILNGEGINTFRKNDRELLLNIRNGKLTYEEIFSLTDELEIKFKESYVKSKLPEKPDINKVNNIVVEINKSVLKE